MSRHGRRPCPGRRSEPGGVGRMTRGGGELETAAGTRRVAILMYHSFAEREATAGLRPWTVPPSLFAEQLAAVAERGAAFARVSDVPALLAGTGPLRPTAVISIDDAYADVLNIIDTLGAHRAPATLFVPTQFVGRTAGWMSEAAERLPVLGWQQLGELARIGVELGSHGHAHIAADVN